MKKKGRLKFSPPPDTLPTEIQAEKKLKEASRPRAKTNDSKGFIELARYLMTPKPRKTKHTPVKVQKNDWPLQIAPTLYVQHLRVSAWFWAWVVAEADYYDRGDVPLGGIDRRKPFEPVALFPYYRLIQKDGTRDRASDWASRHCKQVVMVDKIENTPDAPVAELPVTL